MVQVLNFCYGSAQLSSGRSNPNSDALLTARLGLGDGSDNIELPTQSASQPAGKDIIN